MLAGLAVAACGDDSPPADSDTGSDTDGTDTTDPTTDPTQPSTATDPTEPSTTGATDPTTDTDDPTTTTDTEGGQCPVPQDWTAPSWDDNTVEALALRAQLATLTGDATMRGAETGAVVVDEVADLTAIYDGEPSLAAITPAAFDAIVGDSFEEFVALIAAGEQDLINNQGEWDPGPEGGIFGDGDRGLNEGGIEPRQIVDKGLFGGGAFYNYAVGLTAGTIDEATIDAIAAIWGNNATLEPNPDELDDAAGYAHGMGFHAQMAQALIAAKAHAADPNCEAERDEALVTFFNLWEQAMFARMVFYAASMNEILVTATTDNELAEGLHELAEGIGLAAGFYGMPDPESGPLSGGARIITDADVEAIMTAFGVDLTDLGLSTTGMFVESLPNYETAVEAAEGVVMDVYGVDAATIATYRDPTPG